MIKKLKIYLDTSVIGGCFDEIFRNESISIVDQVVNKIRIGFISDITLMEFISSQGLF